MLFVTLQLPRQNARRWVEANNGQSMHDDDKSTQKVGIVPLSGINFVAYNGVGEALSTCQKLLSGESRAMTLVVLQKTLSIKCNSLHGLDLNNPMRRRGLVKHSHNWSLGDALSQWRWLLGVLTFSNQYRGRGAAG